MNGIIGGISSSMDSSVFDILVADELNGNLKVNYDDYSEFIWFGSAVDRNSITISNMFAYDSITASSDSEKSSWYQNLNAYDRFIYKKFSSYLPSWGSTFFPTSSLVTSTQAQSYITSSALSASIYDDNNTAYIAKLVDPLLWSGNNEDLQNIVSSFAHMYDLLRLYAKHMPYTKQISYNEFNNIPSYLMKDFFNKYGMEQYGYWGDKEMGDYYQYNSSLSSSLEKIKNEIWFRVANNMTDLLKSKGTVESAKIMFRAHGLENNVIKIKEFSRKQSNLQISRYEQPEVALMYDMDMYRGFFTDTFMPLTDNISTEFNCSFKPYVGFEDKTFQPIVLSNFNSLSCSIFSLKDPSVNERLLSVHANRIAESNNGYFIMSGSFSSNVVTSSILPIFDKDPLHIYVSIDSNYAKLDVRKGGVIQTQLTGTFNISSMSTDRVIHIGCDGFPSTSAPMASEIKVNEVRILTGTLSEYSLNEHSINYKNISLDNDAILVGSLLWGSWRCNDNVTNQQLSSSGLNKSYASLTTGSSGFPPYPASMGLYAADYTYPASSDWLTENSFTNELWPEYSYIQMPLDCQLDNKIRINNFINGAYSLKDNFDYNLVCIELNMIDYFNEYMARFINESFLDDLNGTYPLDKFHMKHEWQKKLGVIANRDDLMGSYPDFTKYREAIKWIDLNFLKILKKLIPINVQALDGIVIENPAYVSLHRDLEHYQTNVSHDTLNYDGFSNLGSGLGGDWWNNLIDVTYQPRDPRRVVIVSSVRGGDSIPLSSSLHFKEMAQSGQVHEVKMDRSIPSIFRKYKTWRN